MPRKTNKQKKRERFESIKSLESTYKDALELNIKLLRNKYGGFVYGCDDVKEIVESYYNIKERHDILKNIYPNDDIEILVELLENIRIDIINNVVNKI